MTFHRIRFLKAIFWCVSQGDRGDKGSPGPRGSRGDCGAKGEPGTKGTSGEPVSKSNHFSKSKGAFLSIFV